MVFLDIYIFIGILLFIFLNIYMAKINKLTLLNLISAIIVSIIWLPSLMYIFLKEDKE